MAKIVELISPIQITQETDFHKLFSTISFITHCVPEESITAVNKASMILLFMILRSLEFHKPIIIIIIKLFTVGICNTYIQLI